MGYLSLGTGSSANDGTGDPLKTIFDKIKSMLIELYGNVYSSETGNKVFATPDGTTGLPSLRSMALNDLPDTGAAAGDQLNYTSVGPEWSRTGNPAGSILSYAAASAPTGWLVCDGAEVSRATYSDLYAVISTMYGVGDGATTFNLPDLQGRGVVGVGQGDTAEGGGTGTARLLADEGGAETHTLTSNEVPNHSHTYQVAGVTAGTKFLSFGTAYGTTAATSSSSGGGQDHNNMQPFLALTYIIKT